MTDTVIEAGLAALGLVLVFWSTKAQGFASLWMAAMGVVLSGVAINFLRCLGRMDDPDSDEQQRAGGLYLFVGFAVVLTVGVHPFFRWWEAILMALFWAFWALILLTMTREGRDEIVSSAKR